MKLQTLRNLMLGVLTLMGGLALADVPAGNPDPLHRYMMVLTAGTGDLDEPDVTKHGGRAKEKWKNRRVVEVPLAALDALRRHPKVAFLALVNDGTETDAPKYVLGLPSSDANLRSEAVTVPPTWDSGLYEYDGSGNIKEIGADVYRYDLAQRLTSAAINGEPVVYKYDSFGNLVERNIGSVLQLAGTSAQTNHLDHTRYDRAGNQLSTPTQEFRYDGVNMMVDRRMGTRRRYIYTADDERIGVRVGNHEWYWSIRDFSGRVLARFEAEGADPLGNWYWAESYHYRDGALSSGVLPEELVVGGMDAGRYFHLDHLGTPRLMTNHDRQKIAAHDYHPFGREQTRFNQEMTDWQYRSIEKMQFTGHERDYLASMDSNDHGYLDYMHARYYSPSVGRFLSVDPKLNVKRALRMPQNWNRYSYVMNNPLKYTDPTGEDVSIRLNFRDGNWSEEERKKIIAQVAAWYKAQNVGKVYVFDGSKANHGANFLTRLFSSGYATLAGSGKSGISRPHVVYTGQFSGLPAQQRLNAISNSVVHETAAHKFHGTYLEGSDGLAYSRGGLGGQDPQVRQRYGTVADSYMYDDAKTRPNVVNGPIPIHPGDQRLLRQQVGPHAEVEPPDDID